MTFIMGEEYSIVWNIDGEARPSTVTFTGEGKEIDGEEFGEFENVNSGKLYYLSKRGFAKMQAKSWGEKKVEW
ncbi:MAG: hypothetical protein GOVbin2066_33 [Prokaryotic dsDNA virus sp.]|nr:MAG: hypothetical protein GOVbin2066_33 [Prokaryotic dsDNA virus sp.]|tara:strand:+ start:531 stop:749 length:219 start_codon:yes stop_codon:yes gene_type:complete